jgi:hypothetical protein
MNRRSFLWNAIAGTFAISFPYSTEAVSDVAREAPPLPPPVWDLMPGEDLPESYVAMGTETEKQETLKSCLHERTRPGHLDCYPLREGDIFTVHRAFKTYSLFLISNPEWLGPSSDGKIAGLYSAYKAFARAIGNEHAAVFFWKKEPAKKDGKLSGSDLAAQIDASRCTAYEKTLGLTISSSPHVVVTTKRPTPTTSLGDYVLLQLGDLSPESTDKLLTKLADGLVAGNLSAEELNSAKWWLGWRDVATDVLRGLAEIAAHIKVKIKSEFVDVEIDGHK